MIGKNEIGLAQNSFVCGDYVFVDIEPALITHYRVKDYSDMLSDVAHTSDRTSLTPKERARLVAGLESQIPGNGSDGLYDLLAGRIAGEEDIKVRQIRLF